MERNTESPRRFGPGIVALPDSVQRGVLWGVQRNKEWNGLSVAELFASIAACPDNPEATVRHDNNHESTWWLDAYCDIDPIRPTPCESDADCMPEEVCSSWNQLCEVLPLNP